MRTNIVITGMALGLMAAWMAMAPFMN